MVDEVEAVFRVFRSWRVESGVGGVRLDEVEGEMSPFPWSPRRNLCRLCIRSRFGLWRGIGPKGTRQTNGSNTMCQ
jgi:hypothetical protein